ncbi:MAG: Gfo/Idh/MocA family oxidoreductase [Planctomycetota bacterium]
MDRRTALQTLRNTAASAAAATTLLAPSALAEDDTAKLQVGLIGGGRGLSVAREFRSVGMEIKTVCDVDDSRRERASRDLKAKSTCTDLRDILKDDDIQAVIVATPDHWHVPAALLALQAGKHVYVEKPCSHNIREGRMLVDAAKSSGKIVQVGTQTRSTPVFRKAIELVHSGAIGEVKMAKAWNSQRRSNIGHEEPSKEPAGLDYDLWVGPAPKPPYQKNRSHYTWHWWHDFGTGDAGNDGVHELDVAVWGLQVDTHPARATGHGTKLYFDDDQQFPDTQHVTFEYPDQSKDSSKKKILVFENRIWTPYREQGFENGVIFYGTDGYLAFEKNGGYKLFGPRNQLREEQSGTFSTKDHARNFLSAVQGKAKQNAPAAVGHLSATLAHLANIIAKSGLPSLEFDPEAERITNDQTANELCGRIYREGHWAVPS